MSDTPLARSNQQTAESLPEGTIHSEQGPALPFARAATWIRCHLTALYKWVKRDGLTVVEAANDRTGTGNRRCIRSLLIAQLKPYKERSERDQRDGSYNVRQGDSADVVNRV